MSLDKRSAFIYSDEQLIARFQSGDERAYVELVNRYKDRLLNFVFQFLGCFRFSNSPDSLQVPSKIVKY